MICYFSRIGAGRWFLAASLLSLVALQNAPAADATLKTDRYQIQDRGQPRLFEVARDEVQIITRAHKQSARSIPAQADAEAVRQQADALNKSTGDEVNLVLYEVGQPHNEFTRCVLTKQVLVELEPGRDAQALAGAVGTAGGGEAPVAGYFILEAAETGGALALAESLKAQPGVRSAEPLLARLRQKRLVPNDTIFPNQWHLLNTGQKGGIPGIDVNITNVWNTYRGTGIRIAIVDDGLQRTHPDLQPNYDATISTNLNDQTPDPSPDVDFDYHGTACAGIAAARGNNTLGVAGAAFEATLGGIRLIGNFETDADEAVAMSRGNDVIHIKSNSWGPFDDGETVEGPGTLTTAALAQGAQTGRGGKGTIYVWAGGNGLQSGDNANYDGYVNSIYTVAIAAVSDQGNQATYSERGACIVVAAPSNSSGRQGTTTTDLVGEDGYNFTGAGGELPDKDYSQLFGGTSSATPLAAGVIALMLQANPNLGWRDVQEILISSATKVRATDVDWTNNSAGFHFNHKFGAGLINAGAAVGLATNWVNLGPQTNDFLAQTGLSVSIPDNNATGITRSFALTNNNLRVEQVTVTVNINHTYRGDLEIILTSPNGTQSRLAEPHGDPNSNYSNWKFMSVRNWGESSRGTWTVKIADRAGADVGTLTSIRLDVYGTKIAPNPNTADLELSMSDSPDPVPATTPLTYTLTVHNNGLTNASAVTLTDVLPAGVTFGSVVPSQGTATNFAGVVTCNLGPLASNATATVTLTVTPTQAGSITNIATVTGTEGDSFLGNNTAFAVTTVSSAPPLIVNVAVAPRGSSAIINWDTLTNATGQIEYGLTTAYGSFSPFYPALTTNHAVMLVGLIPETNYYFRVIAEVGTNVVRSGPMSFSTSGSIIVDNPQARYTGPWTLGTSSPDKYGTYFQSTPTVSGFFPTAQATYAPNLPLAAKYDVYIWYPAGFNRTTNAQVTIFYNGGSAIRSVNQTINGGSWQLLGAGLDFPAGADGFAVIGNNTGESGKVVMADAMRWAYSPSQDNPGDGTVPQWWADFYFGEGVDASLDPDGDGQSSYMEYIVGTDPTDPSSRLQVGVEQSGSDLQIKFSPMQGGRVYQLVQTTDLSGGTWTLLPDEPTANASEGMFLITNTSAPGAQFYRLAVRLAP